MDPLTTRSLICPHCLAPNLATEDRCEACGRVLTLYIGPPERVPRRLSLGSLMLLIALVAVCLGLAREAPELGVILLVHVVPAFYRTVQWTAQCAADGRSKSRIETIGMFLASCLLVWLILLLGSLACVLAMGVGTFFTIPIVSLFFPGNRTPDWAVIPPGLLGVAGGVFMVYHLVRVLWPITDYGVFVKSK